MVLKEAWKKRDECFEQRREIGPGHFDWPDIINKANDLYRHEVEGFFELNFIIDWTNGDVDGTPLPIPASDLGL